MEIVDAFQVLATFAEGLPHDPQDPLMAEYTARLECAPEAVIALKKACVFGASALKSVEDRFGLPADTVMNSIATAIAGMGDMLENPGIFEEMTRAREETSNNVVELVPPPEDGAPEAS